MIALRNEWLGGVIAIMGTLAFFMVNLLVADSFPDIEAAWFAVPGALYVLAWYIERRAATLK
jgi:hypothetical protein